MRREKIFTFPSMKSKREFDEKFNDGSFVFQWATINEDGSVEAHYSELRKAKIVSKKAVLPSSEKQLNLFV